MNMWFDSDNSVLVRWFFVKDDGPVFPGWHRFGSGNWASSKEDWFGPGELPGRHRGWSNGAKPRQFSFDSPKGELDWYRKGAPQTAEPLCTDAEGRCPACGTPNTDCASCITHIPAHINMSILRVWVPTGITPSGWVSDEFTMTLAGSPEVSGWLSDQTFDPPAVGHPAIRAHLFCNSPNWGLGTDLTAGFVNADHSMQKPFGATFYQLRPFLALFPAPGWNEEWDVQVGTPFFYPTNWYIPNGLPPIFMPQDYFADGY